MSVAVVLRGKGSEVIGVSPETMISVVAEIITNRRIGAVVVRDGEGHLAGILSERDVVRGLALHGAAIMGMTAAELMTTAVRTVTPETSVTEATAIMDQGYFRHLPVCGPDGKMLGIVSVRDLVRYHIHEQKSDVESLQAYVSGRGYGASRA